MVFGMGSKKEDPAAAADTTAADATPVTDPNANPIKAKEELAQAAAVDGQTPSDTSKLRTFLMILKRFIGVTDIAAVRFSLPAQLMEPIPNLEYWHYLDRPETFAAIGDSEDPVERMLACLRFWFTKDLKYVKGKPCKPYNSSLGEFFRCTWEVENGAKNTEGKPVKVNYITEQTSHHPPVSAFVYDCPDKGIEATGYDQLSAKFTGTSVKVTPGQYNQGIFIKLKNRDNEEYHLTHPAAFLGGFLRGSLYITVADVCTITCEKTGLKTMLHYLEEGYFGKTQNKVEGVIYKPSSPSDTPARLKDIPASQIVGRIDGVWTEKLYYTAGSTEFKKVPEKERVLLMDVTPLLPVAKKCPSLAQQLPNESRRFWNDVTEFIQGKQFAQATTRKQQLEEVQRQRAAERDAAGKKWHPRFFTTATEADGRAILSEDGKKVMDGLQKEDYALAEPQEYGAL